MRAQAAPEAPTPVAAPPQAFEPFDLGGDLGTLKSIATATGRVAQGLASGALDRPRARLLLETLEVAREQLEAALGEDAYAEERGRELSEAELRYVLRTGAMPPGTTRVSPPLRVEGYEWVPGPDDPESLPEADPPSPN